MATGQHHGQRDDDMLHCWLSINVYGCTKKSSKRGEDWREREKENESQQQAIAAGDQHNLVVGLSITLERISWGRRMWPQAIRIRRPPDPACGEAFEKVSYETVEKGSFEKQYWGAGGWGSKASQWS